MELPFRFVGVREIVDGAMCNEDVWYDRTVICGGQCWIGDFNYHFAIV